MELNEFKGTVSCDFFLCLSWDLVVNIRDFVVIKLVLKKSSYALITRCL